MKNNIRISLQMYYSIYESLCTQNCFDEQTRVYIPIKATSIENAFEKIIKRENINIRGEVKKTSRAGVSTYRIDESDWHCQKITSILICTYYTEECFPGILDI